METRIGQAGERGGNGTTDLNYFDKQLRARSDRQSASFNFSR
jgi:hypothetical protein